jgi:integrase
MPSDEFTDTDGRAGGGETAPLRLTAALAPVSRIAVETNPAQLYLAGLTPLGRRSMRYRLRAVARLFGYPDVVSVPWALMRFEHVAAVRAHYLDQGLAPKTINTAICALSGVARSAWKLGQMSYETYARTKSVEKVNGSRLPAGRALSQEEFKKLFAVCAADGNCSRGARDAALIGTLAGGGLRRTEVISLDFEHYDPATGALRVIGKGNKERMVYLTGGARQALDDWLQLRGGAPGPLFTSTHRRGTIYTRRLASAAVYSILVERAEEAGLAKFTPHDLRRTFISDLLDAGADLVAVSKLVGHDDPNTTAKYDRRGERAKRQAAALVKVPYRSAGGAPDNP